MTQSNLRPRRLTDAQSRLVGRTFGVVGVVALVGLACLIALGVFAAATEASTSFASVLGELFVWYDARFLTYPLLVGGVGGLWIRQFLRAGRVAPPTP